MFREMRRIKRQVSQEDCLKILKEEKRAAFSVIGEDGYPYSLPVDFYYDEDDQAVYIHTASEGHKIDALKSNNKVCFTVWNQGFKKEGHWEWNATSVVIFGRASLVDDRQLLLNRLEKLAQKYFPTQEEIDKEMNSPAAGKVAMIKIEIDHMTGKLVSER